jgi:hypothetical protein
MSIIGDEGRDYQETEFQLRRKMENLVEKKASLFSQARGKCGAYGIVGKDASAGTCLPVFRMGKTQNS